MKIFSSIGLLPGIPAIFMAGIFLLSCENDLDTIQQVSYDPNAPDEVTQNLNVVYNDSGYAQIQIFATLAETYSKPQHITKLKEGLKVDFYSGEGEVVSRLTAINGELNFTTGKFTVRDSVVLHNLEKNQFLETEELHWNQIDSTIYTDKHVIIRTKGKGITGRGKGLRTTQLFDTYTVLEPVGSLNVDED